MTESAASVLGRGGISVDQRWHYVLREKVLKAHPEVTTLAGPDWRTAVAAAALLALQWSMAWAVSKTYWWVVFLAAFTFGQTLYHSTGVLVHDAAHRLIFKGPRGRLAFDLLLEAILTSFGFHLVYQYNHFSSHHPKLGDYDGDYEHEDACYVAARRAYREKHPLGYRLMSIGILVVHLLPFGIITDTLIMPRLIGHLTGMPTRDPNRQLRTAKPPRRKLWFFAAFSLAVHVGLFMAFGFLGWLYQVWTFSLCASRWGASIRGQILSEHDGENFVYPTRSTYWWGNWIFFNIGYHVEHHTFSNVPWTKLPKLRAMAPEFFNIGTRRSYYAQWWDQVKSDFTRPRRCSAADPGAVLARQRIGPAKDAVGASAVHAAA